MALRPIVEMTLGSWPYLVKWRAREPQRGKWKTLLLGTTRFFFPSSRQENGARPPHHPVSPKLAKSLTLSTSVQQMRGYIRPGGVDRLRGSGA
jgi:hypothetical protein